MLLELMNIRSTKESLKMWGKWGCNIREEYEEIYSKKEKNLQNKEKEIEKILQKKEKEIETLILANNEKIQVELVRLREKESLQHVVNESELRKIRLMEGKIKDKDIELDSKIKELELIKNENKLKFEKDLENVKIFNDKLYEKERNEIKNEKIIHADQIFTFNLLKQANLKIENDNDLLQNENKEMSKNLIDNDNSIKNILKDNLLIREEIASLQYTFKSNSRKLDMKLLENLNLK